MKQSYAIVTPAYNESRGIAVTIESVICQTIQPLLWVIVDDGSTDQTADIVKRYAAEHPWIQYVCRPRESGQSYYGSNVYAIKAGYEQVKTINYDFLAILDADISLPKDYYEQILMRIKSDEKLGIASGVYIDRLGENRFRKVLNDRRSTPKALMVFRKECYEAIGGFLPMKYGGEDTCACFTARMHGWKTWSFPDIVAIHNKPVGTGHAKGLLKIRFRQGIGEYFLATHPLFVILKSLRRCFKEPPFFIGGLVRIAGFVYAYFMGQKRQISDELVRYIQKEQLGRVLKGNKIPVEYTVTDPNRKKFKVCLAASAGGHLSQLLKLAESWNGYNTFCVTTSNVVQEKLQKYGNVYVVGECNRQHLLKVMSVLIRCIWIILKERPDIVISTGAAAGCIMCFLGKITGAKIVWMDSITNVDRLSLSGRMVRHIADLFLTQWQHLAEKYKNVEYAGMII